MESKIHYLNLNEVKTFYDQILFELVNFVHVYMYINNDMQMYGA